MKKTTLTKKQQHQEGAYQFPYHYLDLACEEYKLLNNVEYLSKLELIKRELLTLKSSNVLDAGCGDGRLCYELNGLDRNITGVDYSRRAIEFAKIFNPDVDFYVQDLSELKLSTKYDVVLLIDTLEHIIPQKIPAIIKNLSHSLMDNGKLIITVPTQNLHLQPKHYQHFTIDSLEKILQPYFKIEKSVGYSNNGYKKMIFTTLRRLGYFLFPFRNYFSFVKSFLFKVSVYYQQYLSVGSTRSSLGILAVCTKCR